jgi:DNA (cytosine-5)-methyltransferase 1
VSGAYYNEIEPYAAEWLRNLIVCELIADGEVDTRSIEDVRPDDLRGFTQCHFFAGIGVWSHALRLAGVPDSMPVWTGSCPCQPFSAAGQGRGFDDERHLWPAWHYIIEQCRPGLVFGEQVASKDAEPWIDLVHTDMETLGYAFWAVPFPAASVGAPHIRDRAYFVAYDDDDGCKRLAYPWVQRASVYDAHGRGPHGYQALADAAGRGQRVIGRQAEPGDRGHADSGFEAGRLEHTLGCGRVESGRDPTGSPAQEYRAGSVVELRDASPACVLRGHWADAEWIWCRDGKYRPVEPGTFPLAHGAPARVGRLRAYGNAIVATQAAEFIKAALACRP